MSFKEAVILVTFAEQFHLNVKKKKIVKIITNIFKGLNVGTIPSALHSLSPYHNNCEGHRLLFWFYRWKTEAQNLSNMSLVELVSGEAKIPKRHSDSRPLLLLGCILVNSGGFSLTVKVSLPVLQMLRSSFPSTNGFLAF